MKVKAILFDGDGVTLDPVMFSVEYQKRFGVSPESLLSFFKGKFQDCMQGKSDIREELLPFLKDWKWEGSVDEFLQFWFKTEDKVNENVIDVIKKLKEKGIRCFLIMNQERYRKGYILNQMGFDGIFDSVFASCDVGFTKPQIEFFDSVLRKIESDFYINIDEIIMFDDSKECVDSANKFGIKSFLYEGFDGFKDKIDRLT